MNDPVTSSLANGSSSTATTNISFAAQPTGTLLLLSVVSYAYRTTSGPDRPEANGWTILQSIGGSGQFHGSYVWYKIANGSETAIAYTIGVATQSAYALAAVTNIDTLDPLETSAQQQTNTSGNSYTTPVSATLSSGRKFAVGHLTFSRAGELITQTASWLNGYSEIAVGSSTSDPGLIAALGGLAFDGGGTTSTGVSVVSAGSPQARAGVIAVFRVATVENATPTVDAGDDQVVDPNLVSTFNLTATASDSDGTIASYLWEDITASPVTLPGTGASRTVAVTSTATGSTHTYRVTVTDDGDLTASDTVVITMLPHTRWLGSNGGVVPVRRQHF